MHVYPFSAVVGSDDLVLALTLAGVSPEIGGVLVRGEKGTAKSTAVRAQAALLPPVTAVDGCRFSCDPAAPDPGCPDGPHAPSAPASGRPARLVELPVGAGEDRVIGSLHLGKALSGGSVEYEPGLLARAHRGVLYVDEVNLLHDHLVDLLLDAAAMGRATVERDGVSVSHAARFCLVGTMNPEEGELRPQLLDRFGLSVDVAAPRDPALRVEIVRRRLAFDADPEGFRAAHADAERELSLRIAAARALLPDVVLDDDALLSIARVCAAFDVDGMRADLVCARAAAAHAAWCGRDRVTREDVRAAARLALPHRRRRTPLDGLDGPGADDLLDEVLGDDPPPEPDPGPDGPGGSPGPDGPTGPDGPDGPAESASADEPGSAAPDTRSGGAEPRPDSPAPVSTAAPEDAYRTRLFTVAGTGKGVLGRRSRAVTTSGRTVGDVPADRGSGPVHLAATIRSAAARAAAPARRSGRLAIVPDDLRRSVREGRESNLVLLCVDASGSMAARRRMTQVKTAVLSLLMDAYRRRDKVGLVTFRNREAVLALPPTGSVDVAAARLRELPAGGRTPLAEGLLEASEVLRRERLRDPDRRALLVVVTDGRATAGPDALARSLRAADHVAAEHVARDGLSVLVVDSETGRFRMGLAAVLAGRLGAEYTHVGEVSAESITSAVTGAAARGRAA
ncbi:magnesium chelatase subunit D [Actinorugispora endophytica]|uniref:Mg-protoporphyrin IX chelatase n=1 Tax=Actinorugispora endophytica TaxID=1605990 RepID=A0A4R6V7H4_9ACTN|nr:magnesium chelatase subunit D [Actinorugispora endophytica]